MKSKSNPFLRSASLIASLAFALTHTAFALNFTWDGGDGSIQNWSEGTNWNPDGAVTAGNAVIFAGTNNLTTNNDLTALSSITGITFNSGAGAFTLNGNSITLNGNITDSATTATQKIGFAVDLATTNRTITVAASGRLELSGAWSRNGAPGSGNALSMNGAGITAWTGSWNDADISMAVSGGGTLEFNSASGGIIGRRITVGNGTVSVLAGTHNMSGASNVLGDTVSQTSTYNQSAGSMTMGTLNLAIGTVNMNLSGTGLLSVGTFTFGNTAVQNTVTQTVNVGTGAELRATTAFDWGNSSTSTGRTNIVEINGGKFSTVATTATNALSDATLNLGNGGTLQARAASTTFLAGLDTVNIKDGGAKIDTQANNITISNNILNFSGATTDSLTKLGAGTLTLSGTGNTYSGGAVVSEGTLKATNVGALPGYGSASKVSVANTATLALNYGGASDWTSINVDNLLSANGVGFASGSTLALDTTNASSGASYATNITIANLGLSKLGTTMLTISGNNSYTGATTVNAGVLNVQNANALGTTAAGTTVASGAAIELQGGISYASEALAIDGIGVNGSGPGGSGAATNNGALRNVSGSNTWNGNITVGSAAVSRIGADSGSTLTIAGDINLTGAAATTQTTLQGDGTIIVNGKISGTGQLSSSSTGNSGVRTLTNNANDYSSKTNLNGGRLRVGANGALGASTVVFNGGTLSSDGSTARTIANALSVTGAIVLGNSTDNGKLTFTNAATLTTGARTWTVNSDAEFQMSVDHSTGTMTKEGAGNLFLTGGGSLARVDINNGTLTISGGTYNSNNYFTVSTLASGPASYVQTGGTFNLTNATNGAYIGNINASTSTFTVSGGAFNVNNSEGLIMKANGTATTTVSGAGTISSTGSGGLSFQKSGSTGTFNLGNGSTFSGGASINDGGTSGMFTASKVVRTAGTSGNNIFNFNGGTLKASAATFIFGDNTNIAANVMAGGGIIDNNTFDITIGQNLLNGGGTDGGMVFKGSGKTTLTGVSTYNGLTTVNGGALSIASAGSLNSGNALTLGASGTADFANAGQTLGAVDNANTTTNALNFSATTGTITLASLTGAGNTRFGSNGTVTGGIATGTVTSVGALNANISGGTVTAGGLLTGTISNGTVGAGSLSSSSVNGGTNTITGAAGIAALSGGTTTVGGVATIGTMSVGTANLNGAISSITTLTGGTVNLGSSTVLTVNDGTTSGTIAGSGGSLTKSSAGTLTLSSGGTYSYTGPTVVTDGKLVVNGNVSTSNLTTVQTGAALGGAGTVGALTIDSGGTLAPGNSPGIFNTGDYNQAGTLSLELNGTTAGTAYDQVSVTGSVTLSGALAATVGYTPVNGDLLFILLNDGIDAVSGTFSGLAQGSTVNFSGFDWQISYNADSTADTFTGTANGNDIALMAVPEPNVAALLGGLGTLLLLRRRRA